MKHIITGALMAITATVSTNAAETDKYLWLEEVEGKEALAWVTERNKHSLGILQKDERFNALMEGALKDYNASDKIPYGRLQGGSVHNFWQDGTNVRGLWRRASLKSYKSGTPRWVNILDIDKLAKEENENWVYKGRECLPPDFGRCLVSLSRGGGDAVVVREYDTIMKRFVAGGFETKEAKQSIAWVDADTVLIATDFGEGTSTDSGYPNQIKLWKRGQSIEHARLLSEGDTKQMGNFLFASHRPDGSHAGFIRYPDFFTQIVFIMTGEDDEAEMRELKLPRDISFQGIFASHALLQLRADWAVGGKTYASGSLVSLLIEDAIGGTPERSISSVYAPSGRIAINDVQIGMNRIFISLLDDVKSKLVSVSLPRKDWMLSEISMPENGNISIVSADAWSNNAFFNYE
ncbi:MAG: S9 family peptidase, partial [Kordiimonadaceae bacterium]|nr:S9 family peptidase [Kordiimonadaceae bacterium]